METLCQHRKEADQPECAFLSKGSITLIEPADRRQILRPLPHKLMVEPAELDTGCAVDASRVAGGACAGFQRSGQRRYERGCARAAPSRGLHFLASKFRLGQPIGH